MYSYYAVNKYIYIRAHLYIYTHIHICISIHTSITLIHNLRNFHGTDGNGLSVGARELHALGGSPGVDKIGSATQLHVHGVSWRAFPIWPRGLWGNPHHYPLEIYMYIARMDMHLCIHTQPKRSVPWLCAGLDVWLDMGGGFDIEELKSWHESTFLAPITH